MIEKQHQEWKKDLEELHEVKAENKRLRTVIETAISQHHRVRPNTVVDILQREYEALNTGGGQTTDGTS